MQVRICLTVMYSRPSLAKPQVQTLDEMLRFSAGHPSSRPKSLPAQWLNDLNSHSRGHGPRLRVWELAGTAPSHSTASKRSNALGSLPHAVSAHPQPRSTGVATRAGQARRQVSSAVSGSPSKSADPHSKVAYASWRCHAATPCRHPARCQMFASGSRPQNHCLIRWRPLREPGQRLC